MSDTPSAGYGTNRIGNTGQEDAQLLALQQMSLSARILSTVNPWMGDRPDIMMELASSGLPPDQLASQGAGLWGIKRSNDLRSTLQGLSGASQRSIYGRLTEQQQRALNQVGYAGPPDQESQGQWGGPIVGGITKVAKPILSPLATVGGPPLKLGLEGLTFMADQPGHLYRTIRMMDSWEQALALSAAVAAVALTPVTFGGSLGVMGTLTSLGTLGGAGLTAGTAAVALTSHNDWWEAFNDTWHGEHVFERGATRRARELLVGDQFTNLAKAVALDLDPYELATEIAGERGGGDQAMMAALQRVAADYVDPGSAEYEKIFGGLMTLAQQEPFRQAVDTLQKGKISFGRDIADSLGFDHGSSMHRLTSGMLDGVWAVSMDPTLMLGKAVKWDRIRRFGVGVAGGDDFVIRLKELYERNGAIKRTFDLVAKAVQTGDMTLVPPSWRGMIDPINEYIRANKGIPIRGKSFAGFMDQATGLADNVTSDVVEAAVRTGTKELEVGDKALQVGDEIFEPAEFHALRDAFHAWSPGEAPDVFEAQDLLEYFRQGDGIARILSGKGTVRGVEHAVLSRRNETAGWGRFVKEAREFRNAWDDGTLEYELRKLAKKHGEEVHLEQLFPSNVLHQGLEVNLNPIGAVADREAGATGRALGSYMGAWSRHTYIGYPARTVGSLIASITTMAPPGKAILLTGPGSEADMSKFIEMMGRASNMPSGMRDEWLNAVMRQGSHSQRIQVLQSFQDTAFAAAGLKSNVKVQGLAETYLNKFGQIYEYGGLDLKSLGGIPAVTGTLPDSEQAVMLVMPDLKEMTKAIRRGHVLEHITRITDSNFVESSMSKFWKPAVLLRLGFIPRSAGEELLAWAARMTTGGVIQEFGARNLAMHEAYLDAMKAVRAGVARKDLTVVQREALNWRAPTHIRPLVNMLSRIGWKTPTEHFVDNYAAHMDHWLSNGIGRTIPEFEQRITGNIGIGRFKLQTSQSAQWYHGLLYGKETSWRRMTQQGVDPGMREAATDWVTAHARSIMAATGAQNASDFEKAVIRPDVQKINVADGRGGTQEEEFVNLHGERERAVEGDWRHPSGIHHRHQMAVQDGIAGPAFVHATLHTFDPTLTGVTPQILAEHLTPLEGMNHDTRKLLAEMLKPRSDTWRATADSHHLSGDSTLGAIGDAIDQSLLKGHVTWDDLIEKLRVVADDADTAPDIAVNLAQTVVQMEAMKPTLAYLDTLNPSERAWMVSAIRAQAMTGGRYYNVKALAGFAGQEGAEVVSKRPTNVLYRGIKDASTIETRPSTTVEGGMDLVLKPQQNNDWGGMVVSTSRTPDQSLGYSSSAGAYNSEGQAGLGAMIEMDGDYLLPLYGTDWDKLAADPITYTDALHSDRIGPQLIGHGHDNNEVAFVMSRNRPRFRPDEAQAMFPGVDMAGQETNDINNFLKGLNSLGASGSFHYVEFPSDNPLKQAIAERLNEIYDAQGYEAWQVELARIHEQLVGTELLHVGDEIVVPHGKWAIQSSDQMEAIATDIKNGMQTRWPWLANLKWRTGGAAGGGLAASASWNALEDWDKGDRIFSAARDEVWAEMHQMDQLSMFQADWWGALRNKIRAISPDDATTEKALGQVAEAQKAVGNVARDVTSWWAPDLQKPGVRLKSFLDEAGETGAGKSLDQVVQDFRAQVKAVYAAHVDDTDTEAVTAELGEMLQGMDPEERELIQSALGLPTESKPEYLAGQARWLAMRDAKTLDDELIAFNLRGQGGFHELHVPQFSPFHTTMEEHAARMDNDIAAALANPVNGDSVQRSRYVQETADGQMVAHPAQSGTRRVHVPANSGDFMSNAVQHAIAQNPRDRTELVETIVDTLINQPGSMRVETQFIRGLSDGARRRAVTGMVENYLDRIEKLQGPWTRPMHGVGYDDPRIARWLSDIAGGSQRQAPPVGQYVVDLPRPGVLRRDPIQIGAVDKDSGIWKLEDEHFGRTQHYDVDGSVLINGERVAGVSQDVAYQEWGRRIRERMYRDLGAGTDESFVIKPMEKLPVEKRGNTRLYQNTQDGPWSATRQPAVDGQVERFVDVTNYELRQMRKAGGDLVLSPERLDEVREIPKTGVSRYSGGRHKPLQPGERLSQKEDLFDVDGNPVPWADRRFMEAEMDKEPGGFLYSIFMPMIDDQLEMMYGFANVVPKHVAASAGAFEVGTKVADEDQWVHLTRARVSDVTRTGMRLPNVAITEIPKVSAQSSVWDRIVRWGFDRVVGPSLDALVRKPMSFHYFQLAHRENMTFRSGFLHKELFEVEVPRVFGKDIGQVEAATKLTDKQLDAARLLAKDVYELDGAATMPDDAVANWLATLAHNNDDYVVELTKAQLAAERLNDPAIHRAAAELMPLDVTKIRIHGPAGSRDTAERLVAAYHDLIPEHVWERGQSFVNQYIDDAAVPLAKLGTREEWSVMRAARNNYAATTQMLSETARQRAIENVAPFLDSHEQRTQFAVISRNLMPFWYAEENFLKRWARTMAIDGTLGLATIRKAQLGYMGIKSAGLIRTDGNGKDWFVYPGSGLLAEALSKLPFIPETLPVGVMFQAQVGSMMPGLNANVGSPSVSPWVALPIDTVTTLMPDALPIRNAILGKQSRMTGQSGGIFAPLRHFIPSTVQRVWEAALGDEDSSRRYASAMAAAMAMMEAEGKGLPDTATPDQEEEYLDKLRNHARIIMWAQVITGFVVPGAPVPLLNDENAPDRNWTGTSMGSLGWWTGMGVDNPAELVSDQYRSYVDNLGIDEGTSKFLADFPHSQLTDVINPLAFSVSPTTSKSGAPLPATAVAMKWYQENQQWVDSMPEAGAWFLPPDDETDPQFDYNSYTMQLMTDLRQRRTPPDFLRALKYREGASTYFASRDSYEEAAAQLSDNADGKRKLDEAWDAWTSTYLTAHPIFAEELVTGEAKQRRKRTIDQLRYAVSDPQAPGSMHMDAIKQMSEAFDAYTVTLMQVNENRDKRSIEYAKRLREAFQEWATGWIMRNPQLEQLWSAVYRPEASF